MFKQTAGVSFNLALTLANYCKFYPLLRQTNNDAAYRILLTESVDISVDDPWCSCVKPDFMRLRTRSIGFVKNIYFIKNKCLVFFAGAGYFQQLVRWCKKPQLLLL